MRFAPLLSNSEDPLVFSHSSAWQDWQRVVFHYVDGTTTAVEFSSRDASAFLALGSTVEIPVPPKAAPLELVIARLRDLAAERDQAQAGERSALRLANSDSLTGLLNRRAFLDLAIGRIQAHRLMLIDIDHFKAINDKLGHDTGDDVLRRVAETIQSIRSADSLAVRLGSEEFALLVPISRVHEIPPEMLLEAVRNCEMPLGWRVTVSLGYADGRVDSEAAWRRLYRLADSALYRAKSDGRDRVCRATDFAEIAAA